MSNKEYHVGTVKNTELGIPEYINTLPQNQRPDPAHLGWMSIEDWFQENMYGFAILIDGEVWTIQDKDLYIDDSIFDVTKLPDGSYAYTLQFYNGGCSFEEALLSALGR